MQIVPRKEWSGVANMFSNLSVERPATEVFVMNTHSAYCPNSTLCRGALRYVQQSYALRHTNDIRYNFLIAGDGMAYEARGWAQPPLLPQGHETDSIRGILIAFVGDYKESEVPPKMWDASTALIALGIAEGQIAKNYTYHNIMLSMKDVASNPQWNRRKERWNRQHDAYDS